MPPSSKIVGFEDAARLVRSGDTVTVSGDGDLVMPDAALAAVERRFLATGEPRDLTLFYPVIPGAPREGTGLDRFAHRGMIRRVIGTSLYTLKVQALNRMLMADELEGYLMPMGAMWHLVRAIAAGLPGVLTPVGLGTLADPRHGGGRVNRRTAEDFVRVMVVDGQAYLYYPAFRIDVAFIRATTADEDGNLSMEEEPITSGVLPLAMAARNRGGTVIAQVKRVTGRGSLHPKRVIVPGILVDAVVVDPDQDASAPYDPTMTGDLRRVLGPAEALPLGPEKVVLRRAALELRRGGYYNLGFGLAASLGAVVAEEGALDLVYLGTEHGPVGGLPRGKECFGPAYNPLALLDTPDTFCLYDGGRLDGTFLGMGEVDRHGNVNVSNLAGYRNVGGFLDIVHAAPRIVFCGLFGGRDEATVEAGRLHLTSPSRPNRKFVSAVAERTFDAARAAGRRVMYVTERAVFGLSGDGLTLEELAPGAELERDVLAHLPFRPAVSPDLRPMDERLFRPEPIGLASTLSS